MAAIIGTSNSYTLPGGIGDDSIYRYDAALQFAVIACIPARSAGEFTVT